MTWLGCISAGDLSPCSTPSVHAQTSFSNNVPIFLEGLSLSSGFQNVSETFSRARKKPLAEPKGCFVELSCVLHGEFYY